MKAFTIWGALKVYREGLLLHNTKEFFQAGDLTKTIPFFLLYQKVGSGTDVAPSND